MEHYDLMCKLVKMIRFMAVFLLAITLIFNYMNYSLAKENMLNNYAETVLFDLDERIFLIDHLIFNPLRSQSVSQIENVYFQQEIDYEDLDLVMQEYDEAYGAIAKNIFYADKEGMIQYAYPDKTQDDRYETSTIKNVIADLTTRDLKEIKMNDRSELMVIIPVFIYTEKTSDAVQNGAIIVHLNKDDMFNIVFSSINSRSDEGYVSILRPDGEIMYYPQSDFIGKNFRDIITENTHPDLYHAILKSFEGERGFGEYDFIQPTKTYKNDGDIHKFFVYTPFAVDDFRWVMWYSIPMNEVVERSGLTQLKTMAMFNLAVIIFFFIIIMFSADSVLKYHLIIAKR